MGHQIDLSLTSQTVSNVSRFRYTERTTPLHCMPIVQTEFFMHAGTRYEKDGGEPKYFVVDVTGSSRTKGLDFQFEFFVAPVLRISDGLNFIMAGVNIANLHYLMKHPMDTSVGAGLYGDGRSFIVFEQVLIEDDLTGNSHVLEKRIEEYLDFFKKRLEAAL